MKTNVTVNIDAELAREARILAAKHGSSLSRLISEELERLVKWDHAYEQARRRALQHMNQVKVSRSAHDSAYGVNLEH